mmetsp:Transcript_30869/g.80562  ORF Transcript_30869/g.80562 Transcript_30869/m.80562 type:complete len:116 (+) Transcript_30869:1957-2304(+)
MPGKTQWGPSQGIDGYLHPAHRPEVKAYREDPYRMDTLQTGPHMDVYPRMGIGRKPSDRAAAATTPPAVVLGGSVPISGERSKDPSMAFDKLSLLMAEYTYNRTTAIQKGARAGC